MSKTLTLAQNVQLVGDLGKEVWPQHITDSQYVHAVKVNFWQCDFIVRNHKYTFTGDRYVRFIVGEHHRSRKIAVHLDDPRGIVYILKDDGKPWSDHRQGPPETIAEVAITLGELMSGEYESVLRYLQLDSHCNYRLSG